MKKVPSMNGAGTTTTVTMVLRRGIVTALVACVAASFGPFRSSSSSGTGTLFLLPVMAQGNTTNNGTSPTNTTTATPTATTTLPTATTTTTTTAVTAANATASATTTTTTTTTSSTLPPPPQEEETQCVPTPGNTTCSVRYYKISDEANGLATSCAAVDQPSDPVVGLDQLGCQSSCDAMEGCNTINFRWIDPNFGGQSTCYRKRCDDFKTAVCTLFTKHKSRDVYTKACGAEALWESHVQGSASDGLFAGVKCPDESDPDVNATLSVCAAEASSNPDAVVPQDKDLPPQTCSETYYKISDEANGLATSCAAVDQPSDPVVGLDQVGCQEACDAMEGCNTINFRWKDPNFAGKSSCYRKRCNDFKTAVCTLFTKHKSRDVYSKACGAAEVYDQYKQVDSSGLFAGVKCPDDVDADISGTGAVGGEPVCTRETSTNRTNDECSVCSQWSSADGTSASTRSCLLWETDVSTGITTCGEYLPSALELHQQDEYQKYLQARWTDVGLCNLQYVQGTTCEIETEDGDTCFVRDQPCHGTNADGIVGGVAGVLSAGWQTTFSAESDNHLCTMCGRGTYGSCDDPCSYRRRFFWSGYQLGRHDTNMDADAVDQLYDAFVLAQPVETYDEPQKLELTNDVLSGLPLGHPLSAGKLPSAGPYSLITVNDVSVTVRDQLPFIAIGLRNSDQNLAAPTVLSTSGVKVYETCSCHRCLRGTFQDGLGSTSCNSCADILPGSDTEDMGADGPHQCKCLKSNDVFLSPDSMRCVSCDEVRNGTAVAPPGACDCPQNTFEQTVDAPYGWITCSSCPPGTSTFNAQLKEHDYGNSSDMCYCQADTYSTGDGCASCGSFRTSDWNAQSESDCRLTESAQVLAIALPVGAFVFALLLGLIMWRSNKKIRELQEARMKQMKEKVINATESVNRLLYPMVIITADNFVKSERMVRHEEARDTHMLITLDTTDELKGFRKTNTIVFFSHQWLAYGEPDPQKVQYIAMVHALHSLAKLRGLDLSRTFVWLDYTSIPQRHNGLQHLSINSLPKYAGECDYFVIVAPTSQHADTLLESNDQTYQDRVWCRAEQLSHGARVGVENMYIAKELDKLTPVTWDWIKPSFKIFSGNLTCCARKHEGMEQCDREFLVTPVLGLYYELLMREKKGCITRQKKEVLNFMRDNEQEVFPVNFKFNTADGKVKQRELFGNIVELLSKLELADDGVKCDDDFHKRVSSLFDQNSSQQELALEGMEEVTGNAEKDKSAGEGGAAETAVPTDQPTEGTGSLSKSSHENGNDSSEDNMV